MGWPFQMRTVAALAALNLLSAGPGMAGVPWVVLSICNRSTHDLVRSDKASPDAVRVIREPDALLPVGATTTAAFIYGEYPDRRPRCYSVAYHDKAVPASEVTIQWGRTLADLPPPKESGPFALSITGGQRGSLERYDITILDREACPPGSCDPGVPDLP